MSWLCWLGCARSLVCVCCVEVFGVMKLVNSGVVVVGMGVIGVGWVMYFLVWGFDVVVIDLVVGVGGCLWGLIDVGWPIVEVFGLVGGVSGGWLFFVVDVVQVVWDVLFIWESGLERLDVKYVLIVSIESVVLVGVLIVLLSFGLFVSEI